MASEFWLSDQAWSAIEPLLPKNQSGARRVDDRRVISGIVHILKSGCRWKDCPASYGPPTTIYNRYNRWSRRGIWTGIFTALVSSIREPDELAIDSTYVKAHRSAAGGKGGLRRKPSAARAVGARPRSMPSRIREGGPTPSCSRPAMWPTSRSPYSLSQPFRPARF
jgi:transposase